MPVTERLRALDRRVVRDLTDRTQYDAPLTWFLRATWLPFVVGPVSVLLLLVVPPLAVLAGLVGLMAVYAVLASAWARWHRLPRGG